MFASDTGGGTFEQPPVGTHIARCIKLIDIGTQKGEYQGQPTMKRQIIMTWELPSELISTGDAKGKPFVISKFYTLSLGEKATLRKDLSAWRGRDFTDDELIKFDVRSVLGKPCMLSVIHSDKAKAKVAAVMAAMKGVSVPAQCNPSFVFSLDEFNQAHYDSLSDGIKKMVMASPEFARLSSPAAAAPVIDSFDDDIPF